MITLKQLFSFYGNNTRKTFWLTQLGVFIASFTMLFSVGVLRYAVNVDPNTLLFQLVVLSIYAAGSWIGWATAVKRCRDLGQSPYFALTLLIPVISIAFFFYIGLAPTKELEQ